MTALRFLYSRDDSLIAVPTLIAILLDILLIQIRGLPLDWENLANPIALSTGLLALSALYRYRSRDIALATRFAGWFVLFTAAMATLNLLLLPTRFPSIDPFLYHLDTLIGWSWARMVAFGATYPVLSSFLNAVYASSLTQVALLVSTLALTGRHEELRQLSGTLSLSGMATVGIWFLFPSFGPASFVAVDPALVRAAGLAVDPAYGAELLRLATAGPTTVSLEHAKGLIAFPSFHTVMAAVCVWHARGVVALRAVFWPLNALMIPAILLHGGHHLVDVPAGLCVFSIALWSVRCMVHRRPTTPGSVPSIA